ncbi:MAG: hypothetical protein K8W52_34520 [Deltaproteobacteria bacterium]|nr:hypothetical protein [Deltaproteobacteria bacterium]
MEPTPLAAVTDDVWRWSVWNEPRKLWFNGHLLRVDGVAILIDPVAVEESVATALAPIIAACTACWCVVTNADHGRAAREVAARFMAELAVPRADAARLELTGARLLDDGDDLAGLRVVRVPDAKSPGESALYWPARRLLVLGDAAVGRPRGALAMLADDKFADPAAARAGAAGLAALGVEIVLVGDGDDLLAGGGAALTALTAGPASAPKPSVPGC